VQFRWTYYLAIRLFASGASGFMYHLHDDPPDNDMLPEIQMSEFTHRVIGKTSLQACLDCNMLFCHILMLQDSTCLFYMNMFLDRAVSPCKVK
jgi:hypothetical protein